MGSQVYIMEGEGLAPKLCVVEFSLPHETLFEIENRFEKGAKYTSLKSVETGVLQLAAPKHGQYDSVFLPGTDDAKVECAGAYSLEPSRIFELDGSLDGSREVWEMRYEGARSDTFVLVTQKTGKPMAQQLAEALSEDFPEGTLELKRVLAGTYRLDPAVAAPGYKVRYRTVLD